MKHRMFKLALFLVLGAVVSVAAAWVIGLNIDIFQYRQGYDQEGQRIEENKRVWRIRTLSRFGSLSVSSFRKRPDLRSSSPYYFIIQDRSKQYNRGPDPTKIYPLWMTNLAAPSRDLESGNISDEVHLNVAYGWPFLCVWGEIEHRQFDVQTNAVDIPLKGTWAVPPGRWEGGPPPSIQYLPIWFGLLVNSIFYGFVLWILLSVIRTMRSIVRTKRGHCIICGYDLRVTPDKCPECGWGRDGYLE